MIDFNEIRHDLSVWSALRAHYSLYLDYIAQLRHVSVPFCGIERCELKEKSVHYTYVESLFE